MSTKTQKKRTGSTANLKSAKNTRRNNSKKRKTVAVKATGRGPFVKILALMLAAIVGLSGYDYYQTGSLAHTIETVGRIGGYLGELPEQAAELGNKAAGIGEKAAELGNKAAGIGEKASELGEQAGQFWQQITGGTNTGNVGTLDEIPEYTGEAYVTVNGNQPSFTKEEKSAEPYEFYSELDSLGRCGYAEAKISTALMPTEERGPIGSVKPSGWHTVKYDIIDGLYLYNRCHLIGYQLTGENANKCNLITGTRYLNVTGMLPWENLVADYIQGTGDQVMYRVTPIYDGNNLVASGVQMEAESLKSDEICFNIFVFNVQPGIGIDYATGDSWLN